MYIQNHILAINSLFEMFAGKVMHSYENHLHPSHFNQHFKSNQTVHNYHTRLATSKYFLLPRVKFSQGQCSINYIGHKVWSCRNTWQYQGSISFWLQTSVQKLRTFSTCWCKVTNEICLTYRVLFFPSRFSMYVMLNRHYTTSLFNEGYSLLHLQQRSQEVVREGPVYDVVSYWLRLESACSLRLFSNS